MKELTTTEIRIESCKKNLEKAYATVERHKKTIAKKYEACKKVGIADPDTFDKYSPGRTGDQYWAMCDLDSAKEALRSKEKQIEELKLNLKKWTDKKALEDKRNDVPRVPAVEEFLARWRAAADKYYREEVKKLTKWAAEYTEYYKKTMEELEKEYGYRVRCNDKEVRAKMKELNVDWQYRGKYMHDHFTNTVIFLFGTDDLDGTLKKLLDQEVVDRRVDLYTRCSAVCGVITDATHLFEGSNGTINGYVVGELGKAQVETILAGGYNIQCLHYRVLVKPLKEEQLKSSSAKTVKAATGRNVEPQGDNYKGMTLAELENLAAEINAPVDGFRSKYSDDRIYRMRLTMAIKKQRQGA